MTEPTKRTGNGGEEPTGSDDASLSARLKSLDARLDQATAQRSVISEARSRSTSNSTALGQALRLSAEFISGVVAGGIVGWIVDAVLGSAPWGLIVCVILGFCAGMLNLMRAAGMLKPARFDEKR